MEHKDTDALKPSAEQISYANLLFFGAWAGIFLLTITFLIYVFGLVSPHVDISVIPQLWGGGVHEYLETTHSPSGWSWISLIGKGDYMSFVGLSFLALLTIACYLFLVRGYFRKKDWIYMTICVLEIIVLCIAASGIMGASGH